MIKKISVLFINKITMFNQNMKNMIKETLCFDKC